MRNFLYGIVNNLLYNRLTRKHLIRLIKKFVAASLKPGKKNPFSSSNQRIQYEKKMLAFSIIKSMQRSIEKGLLRKDITRNTLKLWTEAFLKSGQKKVSLKQFYQENGTGPPFLLVISPGHACNLSCSDCYAASNSAGSKLEWNILDKIISDAQKIWDIKLIVFSGGEPFAYRSQGKDIIDIAKKYPDLLFLAFTNGTLIDNETAIRLATSKNITPAFSVEGMKLATDARRGTGVFNKVINSMDLIKKEGAPFGISVTVNRNNYNDVLSEEFLDFFFINKGAFYGFYFQYLPMGRNANFDLMPNPLQRLKFREHIWKIIEEKRLFILDFWNHGTLVNGCIAAGRDGGYLHIDWNGEVMPCVFVPYSAGNIVDIYKNGGNLMNIYNKPFLRSIRQWQEEQGYGRNNSNRTNGSECRQGNLLIPCPYRDHYMQFLKWVKLHNPEPADVQSGDIIRDQKYCLNMAEYDKELAKLFDPVWEREYLKK